MTPLDLELQLQQHGHALRGLAQDLTRDRAAADDLVQATLQQALHRPPPRAGALGGWLATVLRRLHLQGRRRQLRREGRERAAARPELLPSTVDQVERRDTLRTVTAAVFALEEPYQTAVLLRYFENLTPLQIAARTSTSVATVKSRLQRALLLLRGRLDRKLGGRERWTRALCAATGAPLLTTTTILTTGALLMGPTTKFALGGAAAVLLGALVWTLLGSEPAPAQATGARAPAPAATTAAASGPLQRSESTAKAAVPPPAIADPSLLHPFPYELAVRVVDRLGLPVADSRVLLAPTGCALDEVPERTDADGWLRVHWRGRSESMTVVVATGSDETTQAMRLVPVRSGEQATAVIGGGRSQRTSYRLVGDNLQGGTLSLRVAGNGNGGGAIKLEGLVIASDSFAANPQLQSGLHPFASFVDVQLRKPEHEPEVGPTLQIVNGLEFIDFKVRQSVTLGDVTEAPDTRLEGIVYGEDGKPAAKCPVVWSEVVDRVFQRTQTDEHGAFAFDHVPEGRLELRAGGGDAGLQHLTVTTMTDQTTRTEVQLRREATVRGRALAVGGKPLAGWRVEWIGTQVPHFDACTVGDDGSFVLPNLPGGTGDLLLWHQDAHVRLPLASLGNVLPDNGEVELRYDASVCRGELLLEPLLPDGVDKGAVEVRIFDEASRRGTSMRKRKDSNVFACGGLAAGWYRLEIGGAGLGWTDAGRHYVDGKTAVDLGRVALPGTGKVQLQLPADAKVGSDGDFALQIYRRRGDCDLRIAEYEAGMGNALPLPPGDYFAMWRSATGAQGFTPFTVQTGRDVAVQCMDRDVQAWQHGEADAGRERR